MPWCRRLQQNLRLNLYFLLGWNCLLLRVVEAPTPTKQHQNYFVGDDVLGVPFATRFVISTLFFCVNKIACFFGRFVNRPYEFLTMLAVWVDTSITAKPHALFARGGAPVKKASPFYSGLLFYYSSVFTIAIESSSRALSSVGAGHIDMGSDAFCTFGNAITSRISSIPRRSITSLSRPNARPP